MDVIWMNLTGRRSYEDCIESIFHSFHIFFFLLDLYIRLWHPRRPVCKYKHIRKNLLDNAIGIQNNLPSVSRWIGWTNSRRMRGGRERGREWENRKSFASLQYKQITKSYSIIVELCNKCKEADRRWVQKGKINHFKSVLGIWVGPMKSLT